MCIFNFMISRGLINQRLMLKATRVFAGEGRKLQLDNVANLVKCLCQYSVAYLQAAVLKSRN